MRTRKPLRLRERDYRRAGLYFVTIGAQDRAETFGSVREGEFFPNQAGKIAEERWEEIPLHFSTARVDAYQIMPDHMHGIISLDSANTHSINNRDSNTTAAAPSLSTIIQAFKSASTRAIHEAGMLPGKPVWQRSFYDHIIRNDRSYVNIVHYIASNPQRWRGFGRPFYARFR